MLVVITGSCLMLMQGKRYVRYRELCRDLLGKASSLILKLVVYAANAILSSSGTLVST